LELRCQGYENYHVYQVERVPQHERTKGDRRPAQSIGRYKDIESRSEEEQRVPGEDEKPKPAENRPDRTANPTDELLTTSVTLCFACFDHAV